MLQLVNIIVRTYDDSRSENKRGRKVSYSEMAYKGLNKALSDLTRINGIHDWRTVSVDTARAGNYMSLNAVLECHADRELSPSYIEIEI